MTRRKNEQELADMIMLAQFTPANVRAWMLATPFMVCPEWKNYVDHMISTIYGNALVAEIAKVRLGISGERAAEEK